MLGARLKTCKRTLSRTLHKFWYFYSEVPLSKTTKSISIFRGSAPTTPSYDTIRFLSDDTTPSYDTIRFWLTIRSSCPLILAYRYARGNTLIKMGADGYRRYSPVKLKYFYILLHTYIIRKIRNDLRYTRWIFSFSHSYIARLRCLWWINTSAKYC